MWQESFIEKHALGVEMLNGTKGLIYSNEQIVETDDGMKYTYDVVEFDLSTYNTRIEEKKKELFEAWCKQQADYGSGELQQIALEIKAIENERDSLGKVIQTLEGNGSIENPYKGWKVGMSVEAGKWYYVDDPNDPDNPYLWEAIKSGVPASAVDADYFDVVDI